MRSAGAERGAGWYGFSALQRAEIAEIIQLAETRRDRESFSALQRAEIAEIVGRFASPIFV